jgi:hypothetical protein
MRVDAARRARSVDAIMTSVHAMPTPRGWSLPPSITRWRRRGVLAPAGALAFGLLLTLWTGVTSLTDVFNRSSSAVLAKAEIIGDTVIPRLVPSTGERLVAAGGVRQALHDTLYDTMRIVRFALRAPEATRVMLVESASAALPDAQGTQLAVARDLASGLWEMRTVLHRNAVAGAFAFVVDDAQRIPVRPSMSEPAFGPREQALADTSL